MWLDLWRDLVRWKFLFVLLVDSESWRTVDKEMNTIFFCMWRLLGCLVSCGEAEFTSLWVSLLTAEM